MHEYIKVFFPVHDAGADHWILVVLDVVSGVCEIWDSSPNINATQRREAFATAVVSEQLYCELLTVIWSC